MLTRKFSNYALSFQFEDIPKNILTRAKSCILDNIFNAIGGSEFLREKLCNVFSKSDMQSKSTIIGFGLGKMEKVVFFNSVVSRVLDLDDGHRLAMGHPGTVIIPSTITLSEYLNIKPEEAITALILGYEIYVRLGSAINPSSYMDRGYDSTGTCGIMASCIIACKMMRLDLNKTVNALGIAGSQASGLNEYFANGSMPKILCPGWASIIGINSAFLSKAGFTGPETIIEGKKGICQLVSNKFDTSKLLDKLGYEFGIMGVYFKQHACMRRFHSVIDTVIDIISKANLSEDQIKQIIIRSTTFLKQSENHYPKSLIDAQASIPFSVAIAIRKGQITIKSLFSGLADSSLLRLAKKIRVIVDIDLEKYVKENPVEWYTALVEIKNMKGLTYSQRVTLAKGEPENPLTSSDLEKKYSLLGQNFSEKKIKEIKTMIKNFEEIDSVTLLTEKLRPNFKS